MQRGSAKPRVDAGAGGSGGGVATGGGSGGVAGGGSGGGVATGGGSGGGSGGGVVTGGGSGGGVVTGGGSGGGVVTGGGSGGGVVTGGGSGGGVVTGGGSGGGVVTGGGSGGGVAVGGRLGDACTSDSDCSGVAAQAGASAWCKRAMDPSGLAYPGGYCTRRCTDSTECGAGNTCIYWMGLVGEVDNLCVKGCPDAGGCRAGYSCRDLSLNPGDYPRACFPVRADGGLPLAWDAGPGAASAAGTACTLANQATTCGVPASFSCQPAVSPDGGRTEFTNGMCTGDCSTTLDDAWCGTSRGSCNPYIVDVDDYGDVLRWQCDRLCTGANPSCGRTGYVCEGYNGVDVCRPDCRVDAGMGCPAGTMCSATTGVCL